MKNLFLFVFAFFIWTNNLLAQDVAVSTDYFEYDVSVKNKKTPAKISIAEYEASTKLATTQLLNFAINKIEYPEVLKNNCFEGTILVDVWINRKGEIVKTKVVRSFNETLDSIVLKAFNELQKIDLDRKKYVGAKHLRLPVKFSLQ